MSEPGTKTRGMACPVCKVDLVMSERQGIEIDYCPTCRGVWLDRGELDKIIERSAGEETRYAPSDRDRYDQGHGGHGGGHGGGRHGYGGRGGPGSFLGRLFD